MKVALWFVLVAGLVGGFAGPAAAARKILYIDSYHPEYIWSADIATGIRSVLSGREDVELKVFFMDTKRNQSEVAKRARKPSTAAAPARILIMDDDEMVRDIAREMLVHLGHQVVLAAEGAGAIDRYREALTAGRPFDLVLMDLTIPGGMGGKEAVQGILAMHPQARVIVSSGYSTDPIMGNFREHGFSAAIVKPYTLDELAHLVEAQLSA